MNIFKKLYPFIISMFIGTMFVSNTFASVTLFGLEWTENTAVSYDTLQVEVENSILKLTSETYLDPEGNHGGGNIYSDKPSNLWEITMKFSPDVQEGGSSLGLIVDKTRVIDGIEERMIAGLKVVGNSFGTDIHGSIQFSNSQTEWFYGERDFNISSDFNISEYHTYSIKVTADDKIKFLIDNTEVLSRDIPVYDSIYDTNSSRSLYNQIRLEGKGVGYIKNVVYEGATSAVPTKASEVELTPLEKDTNHTTYFLLEIGKPLDIDASVDYITRDDTAIAGQDYIATSGTATIKAGETYTVIPIEIIGDTVSEPDEKFILAISNPQGAKFPEDIKEITASKTIVNDD